jgi:tRNA(Ile)-lysidine synthase
MACRFFNVPTADRIMGPDELIRKVATTIDGFQMAAAGERILVAVSGGVDSVALLLLLDALAIERRFALTVAHLDHGLRGDAGRRDREFVERLAARLTYPCIAEAGSVGHGPNLEARGREVRHRFLREAAEAASCGRIALGHTENDQAETLLLRLFRGAGARGLGAMSPRQGPIIRPLIACGRPDLVAFVETRGAEWREDETNDDERFERNRVRHRLLPVLEQCAGAGLTARLARSAALLREDDLYLDGVARDALAEVLRGDALQIGAVVTLPVAIRRRVLRLWLTRVRGHGQGVERIHVRAIEEGLNAGPSMQVSLPGGTVWIEGGLVSWKPAGHVSTVSSFSIAVEPGSHVVRADLGWEVSMSGPVPWSSRGGLPADPSTAVFDLETLPSPVVLRSVRRGDRIRPLGLGGAQKLQDLLVNAKVPRSARGGLPLLAAGEEVLWVPGVSRSERAIVGAATQEVIWAEFRRLR